MTDDSDNVRPAGPESGARQKSAAAAAASRARRIGGRAGVGKPAAEPAPVAPRAPISTTKPPAAAADHPQRRPQRTGDVVLPGWLRWAPTGILSAGAVTMAVLLIVFSHGVWWGRTSGQVVREQVLAAAKTCAAAENTYNYTHLDADEQKALACTTGVHRGKLRQAFEKLIKAKAPGLRASQTTQIHAAGIESISDGGHSWSVLVFGQIDFVSKNYPDGRTDPFSARLLMQKAGGKWLVARVDEIYSPLG